MLRVDRTDFTNFCSHTPRFDPKCESSGHGRNITNTVTAIIILVVIKTGAVAAVAVAVADVYVVAKIGMQACVVFCSKEITFL